LLLCCQMDVVNLYNACTEFQQAQGDSLSVVQFLMGLMFVP